MEAFLRTGKLSAVDPGSAACNKRKPSTTPSSSNKTNSNQPWVEKYRPKSIDDVAYQDEVVTMLKKCVEGFDLPNLLFYGPPGTGKTSTILAVCRDLFGPDFKQRVLELNASDERGIAVVRTKVKSFSQLAVSLARSDGVSCPPFKMIVLDEVDSMTAAAQAALRRTMETHSGSTRFCLVCNYVSRIIDPITSRCAKFRFKPLDEQVMRVRVRAVCTSEQVQLDDASETALVETSGGDLRRAITTLHSVVRLCDGRSCSARLVRDVAGVIPDEHIDGMMECCRSGSYERVQSSVDDLILAGYSTYQALIQLVQLVVSCDQLTEPAKADVLLRAAACESRLLDGACDRLQLLDCACMLLAALSRSLRT